MASPQCEDGYTRIANELLEKAYKCKLSDSEWRVWLAITRLCYGFNKCRTHISITRLERETGLYRRFVIRAIKHLESRCMITVDRENYVNIIGIQKDYDQWLINVPSDSQTSNPSVTSNPEDTSNPGDTRTSNLEDTKTSNPEDTPLKKERNKDIHGLFEYWNEKKIIQHRTLDDKTRRALNSSLKSHSVEEIQKAIDNYATVFRGPQYFWTHRWTLEYLLKRGLSRFVDEAYPLENFWIKEKPKNCINAGLPFPRIRMSDGTLDDCGCPECLEELERRKTLTPEERAAEEDS